MAADWAATATASSLAEGPCCCQCCSCCGASLRLSLHLSQAALTTLCCAYHAVLCVAVSVAAAARQPPPGSRRQAAWMRARAGCSSCCSSSGAVSQLISAPGTGNSEWALFADCALLCAATGVAATTRQPGRERELDVPHAAAALALGRRCGHQPSHRLPRAALLCGSLYCDLKLPGASCKLIQQ